MAETLLGESFFEDGFPILVKPEVHHGRVFPHFHDFCEIVYVADGFTLHSVNGMVNILMTGDIFFIRPGEEHSYINAYQTKIYNIIFQSSELAAAEKELSALTGLSDLFSDQPCGQSVIKRILHIPIQSQRSIESACEKMARESREKAAGWRLNLRSQLTSFLVQYSRICDEQWDTDLSASCDYYGYIYKILEYVDMNYASPISMNDLAAVTGISADYMTRRFKTALHMTPSEYIRRFRIARAMELLCTTDLSVGEIALRTGFSDVSLFSRVFKQSAGVSPALYRKQAEE